jgi:riboflavin synthase
VFTGIVEETGRLLDAKGNSMTFTAARVLEGLETGGSIAVNGVCLTVTRYDSSDFTADIMPETLRLSNLGLLKTGERVNLERPLTPSKPLGGHFVQGHIDGTGRLQTIKPVAGATLIGISAPESILKYIVYKGFICIDGISLTVTEKQAGSFAVSIVPHSLANTTLGYKKPGDAVNLEVDILAKYVENFITDRRGKITAEFLSEHGFSTT